MPTSVISNTLTSPAGTALNGVTVVARLRPGNSFRTSEGSEIAIQQTTTTDSNGAWSLTLEENSNITPTGTFYEIEEQIPASSGGAVVWRINVGASNATLQASLISSLPSGVQTGNITQATADARYASTSTLPYINAVLSHGAIGDGSTDDTAAIQAAINAAAVTDGDTAVGNVVYLPKGVYQISSQLVLKNRVQLVGAGRGATRIRATSGFPVSTALIRLGDGTSIVFGCRAENLQVDCNEIAGSIGIHSTEINEQSGVKRVIVSAYKDKGIHISSGSAQNFVLETVEVTGSVSNSNDGILLDTVGSNNLVSDVTCNSAVGGLGGNGIRLLACDVVIERAHIERHTDGIEFGVGGTGLVIGAYGASTVTNLVNLNNSGTPYVTLLDLRPNTGSVCVLDGITSTNLTGDVMFYTSGANTRHKFVSSCADGVGVRVQNTGARNLSSGDSVVNVAAINASDAGSALKIGHNGSGPSIDMATYLDAPEIADPAAPAANRARLYFKDVGGKTALMALFPSGAAQQVAIEP